MSSNKGACPKCGWSYAWDGEKCSHCHFGRHLGDLPSAAASNPSAQASAVNSTMWDVTKQHVEDLRNKALWTAIGVTLLLAPSSAVITKVLGQPKAGLEEALTLWNVLWYTLPLTIAVAIDAGVLMAFTQRNELPTTKEGKAQFWCTLGGVLIVSMLVGGWLGGVETSEWSQHRLGEVESVRAAVDPSGRLTRQVAHGLAHNISKARGNKWILPVAIAIGSLATIANYFTLYGPSMFFSSLVVGAFLGWVWAVKFPAVVADIDRSASPPNQAL